MSSASVGARPATLPPTSWNHQPGGKRTSGGSSGTGSAFSLEVAIPEGQKEGGEQAVVFFEYVAAGAVGINSFEVSTHGAGAREFVWVLSLTTLVKRSRLGMNI
jgi:hypothetical protein